VPEEETSSGLFDARGDIRGRQTDNPVGTTPSGLISNPPPHPLFVPHALPATILPVYPSLGQAPNMLTYIPSGLAWLTIMWHWW